MYVNATVRAKQFLLLFVCPKILLDRATPVPVLVVIRRIDLHAPKKIEAGAVVDSNFGSSRITWRRVTTCSGIASRLSFDGLSGASNVSSIRRSLTATGGHGRRATFLATNAEVG